MELNERELYIKTLRNLEHFEMEANINEPRLYRMTEIFFHKTCYTQSMSKLHFSSNCFTCVVCFNFVQLIQRSESSN